jgi:DNA-binding response OmpR family regulator
LHILSVEDDPKIIDILGRALPAEGHTLEQVTTGEEALRRLSSESFELVILDIGLPGMSGFDVIQAMRDSGQSTPVIMLTAEGSEEATVQGLTAGADDYVVKPFSLAELGARIKAIARRTSSSLTTTRSVGRLEIDLRSRSARMGSESGRLTYKELSILWTLAEDSSRVWSREELLTRVWGMDFDPQTVVLEVHLSRVRSKLGEIGAPGIKNVRGKGYQLEAP